jgi:hypothetical protein
MAPPHTNKPTTIIITAAAAALEVALWMFMELFMFLLTLWLLGNKMDHYERWWESCSRMVKLIHIYICFSVVGTIQKWKPEIKGRKWCLDPGHKQAIKMMKQKNSISQIHVCIIYMHTVKLCMCCTMRVK